MKLGYHGMTKTIAIQYSKRHIKCVDYHQKQVEEKLRSRYILPLKYILWSKYRNCIRNESFFNWSHLEEKLHFSKFCVFNIGENEVGMQRNLTLLPGHFWETDTVFGKRIFPFPDIFHYFSTVILLRWPKRSKHVDHKIEMDISVQLVGASQRMIWI